MVKFIEGGEKTSNNKENAESDSFIQRVKQNFIDIVNPTEEAG